MGKRKTRYVVDEVAIGNVTDVAAMDVKKSKRDSIAPGIVHVPMSSDDDEVGAHPKVKNKDQVDEKGGKRLSKSKEYARERNGAEKAQLWFRRCSRILRNCADEGLSKLIASSLVTWPMKDVHRVCSEWTPIVLSTVLTPDTCEPAWLAMLLGHYHRRYVAECCESWSVEDLQLIIPRLAVDMILYVLKRLCFECSDKYLSAKECQRDYMIVRGLYRSYGHFIIQSNKQNGVHSGVPTLT
ncbi:hypothetical protein CEUSTIGMA_g5233.t1 [Chlamydomonas eustigma]|uniref:Uncharacterized protein n=1 Tax=Chlamydomonas eustigma TaxID=1157962 RepID=A0A250X4U8_9CHLO|nr:hypothetical protein CEUSTIGMA_g5233.t1 [Chlamydomonas eustigma]|eukprot:GAX77790.1 hypothetical protein CEUSTIGMA_g5233.t1 [Chlamydomonas eustigma]